GIDPGYLREDIPVDLLKTQAGGKPIEPDRPGQWLGQSHVEPFGKGVDLYLVKTGGFHHSITHSA
ncbi:hypothetical protein O6486_24750, partial [Salmonella enterica subsp. enterica]